MQLELAVLDWIQLHFRCGFLDWLMPFASSLSNHGEVWILLSVLLLLLRRQRRYGLSTACALTLDLVACNMILKPLIGRARPFALRPGLSLLVPPPGDASFPSGHTAAAFAVTDIRAALARRRAMRAADGGAANIKRRKK